MKAPRGDGDAPVLVHRSGTRRAAPGERPQLIAASAKARKGYASRHSGQELSPFHSLPLSSSMALTDLFSSKLNAG
jgi:hypothetical protein